MSRFWELKKVLDGSALAYVEGLPVMHEKSYEEALKILDRLYSEKRCVLKSLVQNLVRGEPCSGSINDRQKLHSALVTYYQGVEAVGATAEQARLAIELTLIEAKLDDSWKREWFKFVSRKKDNSPLGADISAKDLVQLLHQSLVQQLHMLQSKEGNKRSESKKASNNATVQKVEQPAAANATVAGKVNKGNKKGNGKKAADGGTKKESGPCPFCLKNGKPQFDHMYPLGCPLVNRRSRNPNKLTPENIRKVVTEKQLCRNCFDRHQTRNCDAPDYVKCKECEKRHHVAFHPKDTAAAAAQAAQPQTQE